MKEMDPRVTEVSFHSDSLFYLDEPQAVMRMKWK